MTTTTLSSAALPGKVAPKDTDTKVQATAKIWLAAKVIEDAAKEATKDRKDAAADLAAMLANGDTVTLNGNTTYKWTDRTDQRTDATALLAACEVLHPGLAATLERLKAEDKARKDAKQPQLYTTPRVVRELKLAKR